MLQVLWLSCRCCILAIYPCRLAVHFYSRGGRYWIVLVFSIELVAWCAIHPLHIPLLYIFVLIGRAGTHKIEMSEIVIFMHYIHSSMHKTDVQKKVFKKIDHNTVYMDPKVQNHGK